MSRKNRDPVTTEIGVWLLLGSVMIVAGPLMLVFAAVYESGGLAIAGLMVGFGGLGVRAVGGIWGTLERIARKNS